MNKDRPRQEANPRFRSGRADVPDRSIYLLAAPKDQAKLRPLIEKVLQGREGTRTLEYLMVGLRGTQRSVETKAVPLRDKRNEIIGALAVTRDLTLRKKRPNIARRCYSRATKVLAQSAVAAVEACADAGSDRRCFVFNVSGLIERR